MGLEGNIYVFDSSASLNFAAAQFIMDRAKEAVKERGRFVISLSGGNTPKSLFERMANPPFMQNMPWEQTCIFWGDERYVPAEDVRNNSHMAQQTLLSKVHVKTENVYPVQVELSPAMAASEYEKTITAFFGDEAPVFDVIMLGLGSDGHTASLFPNTDVLHEHTRLVKEVYVEEQKQWRITMTTALINKARNIIFLVTGSEKAETLKTLSGDLKASQILPAQLIKPESGSLSWYMDAAASQFVSGNKTTK